MLGEVSGGPGFGACGVTGRWWPELRVGVVVRVDGLRRPSALRVWWLGRAELAESLGDGVSWLSVWPRASGVRFPSRTLEWPRLCGAGRAGLAQERAHRQLDVEAMRGIILNFINPEGVLSPRVRVSHRHLSEAGRRSGGGANARPALTCAGRLPWQREGRRLQG